MEAPTWRSWPNHEGWQLEGVLNNDIVGGNTTPGDTFEDKSAGEGVFGGGSRRPRLRKRSSGSRRIGVESDSPSRELARADCATWAGATSLRRRHFIQC